MKKFLFMILFALILIPIMNIEANALDYRVEKAIEWAADIANDNKHGYSQANRTGPNYDCSSLVSSAFKNGGFPVSGTLTTSTMSNSFTKAGFTRYKKGAITIQRGDILLKPGSHVELYLGDNTCVSAHSNYDGRTGDSGGKEIAVRNISNCNFCKKKGYAYILRYTGGPALLGDLTADKEVNGDDAIHLLYCVNFPDQYFANQPIDFNKDDKTDIDDAIYLLFHVNFPDLYPL